MKLFKVFLIIPKIRDYAAGLAISVEKWFWDLFVRENTPIVSVPVAKSSR